MDRWTMEVVSDTGTAKKISLYFRGRKIDVMSLVRILNEKERQISWLESQVDQCQEQSGKLRKSFSKVLHQYRDRIWLLREKYLELRSIANDLAGAGDGLTVSPCVPGREKREKAWTEAYTAWINFEERVG